MNALYRLMLPMLKLAAEGRLSPCEVPQYEERRMDGFAVNDADDPGSSTPDPGVFNGGRKYATTLPQPKAQIKVPKPPSISRATVAPVKPVSPQTTLAEAGNATIQNATITAPSRRLAGYTA